jgi:polyhydroxyalkanoate synthesis regulator phasin
MHDLKGLKEDNSRLHKALRETKSGKDDLREMLEKYEWLQRQEKTLKEEIHSLNEKCRQLKADVNRKDSQISVYKDKVD